MRAGIGLFFNAFENQGYGPNIGENYPFVYNFDYKGRMTRPHSAAGQTRTAPARPLELAEARRSGPV